MVIFGSQAVPGRIAGHAAGLADHLLGQGECLFGLGLGIIRQGEDRGRLEAQGLPGLVGDGAADDQGDAAAGAEFVGHGVGADGELGKNLLPLLVGDDTFLGVDHDHVAGLHAGHVGLERQGAGILGRVEEDRGDDAADDYAGGLFVGHAGDLFADCPEHAVTGRFTGGAGTDHVAHEGNLIPFLTELGNGRQAVGEAGLAHGQRMQGGCRDGSRRRRPGKNRRC